VKAYVSKRASRAADRIDARWREKADDPGIFAREFRDVVARLETTPGIGSPFPTARHPNLKRILLPKSRCHIYFEVDDRTETVRIVHIWDGRRERAPKL
jgi:plasmid stabilization system protein ParE